MISALVMGFVTSAAFSMIATLAMQIAFKLIKRYFFHRVLGLS